MTAIETGLQDLKRQHPEWEPWLAVVQEVLSECANPEWDSLVPIRSESQQGKVPLLAGITLTLERRSIHRLLEKLFLIAHRSGTPAMASLKPALRRDLDLLNLFKASLCQDRDYLKDIAAYLGADAGAFQAVAALLPVPLLHACNRRWASAKSVSWTEGYCPVCGAWPAFSEVRGIERSRYFRCGRCGGEWQARALFCPYCGMTDHNELVSLVPEKSGSNSVIDACKRCLGYAKTFTTLQGSPPARILLDDLASAHLDVAALEQGYRRPEGAGYSLNVILTENAATSSFST
jgi:FdhE protein